MSEATTLGVAAPAACSDADGVLLRADAGGIATLTLNRPAQFNALSEALLEALQRALDEIAADAGVRVVVLRGAGRAFCAGHDLREMRATPDEAYYRELFARCGRMMQSVLRLPQPVIACVHGVATAAGCQLVATCDLALAAEGARFGTTGVNLGLFCSTPAVALSRVAPRKQALELLLTGELISAQRACAMGLVNSVHAADELEPAVRALANEIASKSPRAVRIGKKMFYEQLALGTAEAYAYAGDVMAANMMEADATAGIASFLDKRKKPR